jgi:hypothetical protein
MNMKDQLRILRASRKCGMKTYQSKTYAGERCVKLIYNKSGDSIFFNPLHNIGQAMEMLIYQGGAIEINNYNSECVVRLREKSGKEITVSGHWVSKPSKKVANICNAIVNCILLLKDGENDND